MSISPAFALAALIPVLIGPLPQESAALTAKLCGGGEITIPLGQDTPSERECHPKPCHAGTCREKAKRGN